MAHLFGTGYTKSLTERLKNGAVMKDIKKVFRTIEDTLKRSSWYGDDWEIYNRGTYLQLYKSDWFNQNQGGVHFETFIEANQIRDKMVPISVHAEEDCPQQALFIQELLTAEGDRMRGWKGYKSIGDGYVVCERRLPLNFKNLEQRLVEEFNRLRQLEHAIDTTLARLAS